MTGVTQHLILIGVRPDERDKLRLKIKHIFFQAVFHVVQAIKALIHVIQVTKTVFQMIQVDI